MTNKCRKLFSMLNFVFFNFHVVVFCPQGGMKAVIWTDVMMFFVIFITCILVIVMGTAEAGGISHVWETNKEAGRLNLFE